MTSTRSTFQTKKFWLLGMFVLVFFVCLSPLAAHAQTPSTSSCTLPATDVPPTLDTLAQGQSSNGWTCLNPSLAQTVVGSFSNSTTWDCTGPNGATAECGATNPVGTSAVPSETSGETSCVVTYADKYTTRLGEIVGNAQNGNFNPQGQMCGVLTAGAPLTTGIQASTQAAGQSQQQTEGAAADTIGQCLSSGVGGLASCIITAVAYLMFQLAASILGFVGLIFNWVVTVTVFQFGLYFANSAGMLAAWGIARDIGNIILLFGFIFMGICTILDIGNFTAKKTLPRLLIFAVLLNFSLFASEAIVDVANALSAAFYQGVNSTSAVSSCTGSSLTGSCATVGISGIILSESGLSTIWQYTSNQGQFANLTNGNAPLLMILLAIFVTIAAIVLAAGAIMLLVRAIVLAFLLVVSPLGFAGLAIPPLQKTAESWFRRLINEAFFAPVYLLLIFTALKVSAVVLPSGQSSFANAISTPSSSNIGIIFLFVLVFGFLIASLIVAKNMSASGANIAINTSGRLVGAATIGGSAFVARRTVGAASGGAAKFVRSTRFGQSDLGRGVVGFLDKGARSSYDLRSTKAMQALAKNKALPIDLGQPSKAAKGGIHGIEEKAAKDRTEYAKGFKIKDVALDKALKKDRTEKTNKWQAEKGELEKTIREAPAKEADTKAELAALTTAKQEQENAYRSGNIADQGTARDKITALNANIDNLNKSLTEGAQKLQKATEDLNTGEKNFKAFENENDEKMRKNNPALQYARNLENDTLSYLIPFSVAPHANEEAAKTIKGNANKSDIDKALDGLREEFNKKNGEGDGHGGGTAPTPTPPAPASGGNTPPASGGH